MAQRKRGEGGEVVWEEARLRLAFYRAEGEGEKAAEAVGGEVGGWWPLMARSSVRRWREGKGRGGAWACGCTLNALLSEKGKGRERPGKRRGRRPGEEQAAAGGRGRPDRWGSPVDDRKTGKG
jgi:hypothetical protein